LSDNQLSQVEAATSLAHAVARSVLQVLRLNRNALGDAGVRELADALDPQICPGGSLQHLELNSCRIGTPGASHLFLCLAQNEHLKTLRLGDNFLDNSLDIALVESLTRVQELALAGNRLSHGAMQRASQACARNRRRAKDEHPFALRAEMHRLLFQESKLAEARKRVAEDEAELRSRNGALDKTSQELNHLRATEADQQRITKRQIEAEETGLEERKKFLENTKIELEQSIIRYEELQQTLRAKLREGESLLCDLQVQAEQVDSAFARQKVEHPREVQNAKDSIKAAGQETKRLQEAAAEMRQQLKALQERSLIDFRP